MNRAYSVLSIKAVQEDLRMIRGTATTPTPDRMGDVVEPLGISFKNPLPLLHQHDSTAPVGTVKFDKPTKAGIDFEARLPFIDEPGPLKDRVDTAWGEIKAGLIRAVSIGFRPTEYSYMEDSGGIRFIASEVLELSLVTIPANQEATIQVIRSADSVSLAATGRKANGSHSTPPGASGPVKLIDPKDARQMAKKTLAEQISAFEATRAAKSARMTEIMEAAGDAGETLDAAGTEEYDGLIADVKAVDAHLVRLRALDATNKASAVAVKGDDADAGSRSRGPTVPATVAARKTVQKGMGFTRYVIALARSQGNIMQAAEIAKGNERWKAETPEVEMVLRAAIAAGTTTDSTWAGPLVQYQILTQEFIDYLHPLTIIGRIPGLTRIPFKVKVPRMTGGATVNWVGEGRVKPLSALAFDNVTLDIAKIAGIVPLSEELVRFSTPSAEMLVQSELAKAIATFMDTQFVDPTIAATDVSPASITNGVSATVATGTTAAAFRADVNTMMGTFLTNNLQLSSAVWIMSQRQALALSLMVTSLGNPLYPGISVNGGTLLGLPVIASEAVPSTGGSPTDGGAIIMANAGDIFLADDGQVTIDASREASLQMDSAPDSPPTASTVMVSLWQQNMVAIKAERYINWVKRRSTAVAYIQNAKYID